MCGDPKTFSGHKLQHPPEIGDIFLFPSWLTHMVYPFRTPNEERRSVSFNLRLVPKDAKIDKAFLIKNVLPLYLSKGKLATNAQLVEKAIRIRTNEEDEKAI